MAKLYNHAFDFAFEVVTDESDPTKVSPADLRREAIARLNAAPDHVMHEMCSCFDTHVEEPELPWWVVAMLYADGTPGMYSTTVQAEDADAAVEAALAECVKENPTLFDDYDEEDKTEAASEMFSETDVFEVTHIATHALRRRAIHDCKERIARNP